MSVDTSVESYRGRVTRVMSRCCRRRRRRRHRRRRIHLKNAKLKSFATKKLFILEKNILFRHFSKTCQENFLKQDMCFRERREGVDSRFLPKFLPSFICQICHLAFFLSFFATCERKPRQLKIAGDEPEYRPCCQQEPCKRSLKNFTEGR